MVTFILLIVGGLNWLLTAFGFNVVNMILGGLPMVERAVYILVGLAAIYEVVTHKSNCTLCKAAPKNPSMSTGPTGGMQNG